MRTDIRDTLRVRFDYRCAYCGVTEIDVGTLLTVDRFQPRSKGGNNLPDNLIYCCHACNEIKGDYWIGDGEERLLHPLNDDLASHVMEQADSTLIGLTVSGAFHVRRLRLNRPALIVTRRRRKRVEESIIMRQRLLAQFQQMEEDLKQLKAQIGKWEL
jgi:hypothetical protein